MCITSDIVKGLAYIHHKRLMHRDLKSDNVALELPLEAFLDAPAPAASSALADPSIDSLKSAQVLPKSWAASQASHISACLIDFGMARAFDIADDYNDLLDHVTGPVHDNADVFDADFDDVMDEFPVRAVSARVSIPLYCAPEIPLSNGLYDSKADMWAGAATP
jgi:serine/threonine protein kinase